MVRPFTKPDDVHGMLAAKGILTSEGGATSHAAVVARQFGVPCIVGASEIRIDLEKRQMAADGNVVKEGEWISVDGTTGEVFLGKIPTSAPNLEEQTDLLTLLKWADEICATPGMRKAPEGWPTTGLQVWANADYPKDARRARSYGAVGIGLCRTEHMFFETERLPIVQRMILATTSAERTAALDELLPYQRADFDGLFEAMDGYPVIIRLIDPPLHEFMPDEEKLFEEVITMRVKGETKGLAEKEKLLASIRSDAREQPDDGSARRAPEHLHARDRRDAGAGDLRGGCRRDHEGYRGQARGDDPADRHGQRAGVDPAAPGAHRQGGDGREGCDLPLQVRHDDRDPARGSDRGRDRQGWLSSSPSAPTT